VGKTFGDTRRTTMNRNAEDENAVAPCSNATLEGRFLFAEAGFEPKEDKLVPFAITGYVDNANGTADGVSTYIVNGEITRNEPFRGTYTVNADCTGTATFTDGTQFNLVTTPDGRMHTYVQTKPSGVVASGIAQRVGFQNRLGINIPWWVWVILAAGLVFYLTYKGIRLSTNAGRD
jgi:hypothetical protein